MSRLAADKSMGRAEATRQSMLALIDTGTPQEAHPAFWAPFVVVGEGGVTAPHSATGASSIAPALSVQDLAKPGPSNSQTSQRSGMTTP
jgi:hypothetical protein